MQGVKEEMKPLGVRLPDELKQWLKHQAIDKRRSLNAEIIVRLEESRRTEAKKKDCPAAAKQRSTMPGRRH